MKKVKPFVFLDDECDVCGHTTKCARGEAHYDIMSVCEPCSIDSDALEYHYTESVRRGGKIEEPTTHREAWDKRNYEEDMRLRVDLIVPPITSRYWDRMLQPKKEDS